MCIHCEKTSLCATFWLTWTCSHENVLIEARDCIQFVTQFPTLCSTDMFPRSVSTTRRVHVRVRTLRDGRVHTFLTYEVMSMRNLKHITPCLSRIFHRCIRNVRLRNDLYCVEWGVKLYSLTHCTRNKVQHHDFLTYEPFSLCNFWLTRTSPCANCHIWGHVCLQRVTKFLTFYLDHHVSMHCVDYETCLCACSRTKKTYVYTLFELERHVHA